MSSLSASHVEIVVHARMTVRADVAMTAEETVAHAAMTEAQEVHAVTAARSQLLQSRTTSLKCSKHFRHTIERLTLMGQPFFI
jgi:hypothetical protein